MLSDITVRAANENSLESRLFALDLNAPGAVQGIEHGSQLLLCLRIGEHPLIEPVRNASRRFQYNSAFLFMNRSGRYSLRRR
jgi:hypothetical protein